MSPPRVGSRPNPTTALHLIRRGAVEIISEKDLRAKLQTHRPLIVKAGFDPTAPDLHLGHTVLLRKLRHFQDLGHTVIFLIGDATGLVGDPSGMSQTRQVLSWDQVRLNATTYQQQVRKILSVERGVFEVRYNSEWFLGRSPQMRVSGLETFDFSKLVTLASNTTVARLIERDDFAKRLKAGKPVTFLELFYPLMQAYDSVKIAEQYGACDVELGGTDQTFNLLLGRELLRAYGHAPQVVLTMPLLEGTDGVQKMSKSLNNSIGIAEPPGQIFGKLMSIPDSLMTAYLTLLTDVSEDRIQTIQRQLKARKVNPRDVKVELAEEIVTCYHSAEAAQQAKEEFRRVFSMRQPPREIPELPLPAAQGDGTIEVAGLLVTAKLAASRNEARRLLRQGGVKLNGAPLTTPTIPVANSVGAVLQVGPRRFRRLVQQPSQKAAARES